MCMCRGLYCGYGLEGVVAIIAFIVFLSVNVIVRRMLHVLHTYRCIFFVVRMTVSNFRNTLVRTLWSSRLAQYSFAAHSFLYTYIHMHTYVRMYVATRLLSDRTNSSTHSASTFDSLLAHFTQLCGIWWCYLWFSLLLLAIMISVLKTLAFKCLLFNFYSEALIFCFLFCKICKLRTVCLCCSCACALVFWFHLKVDQNFNQGI